MKSNNTVDVLTVTVYWGNLYMYIVHTYSYHFVLSALVPVAKQLSAIFSLQSWEILCGSLALLACHSQFEPYLT